jgi:hypothetical protein
VIYEVIAIALIGSGLCAAESLDKTGWRWGGPPVTLADGVKQAAKNAVSGLGPHLDPNGRQTVNPSIYGNLLASEAGSEWRQEKRCAEPLVTASTPNKRNFLIRRYETGDPYDRMGVKPMPVCEGPTR